MQSVCAATWACRNSKGPKAACLRLEYAGLSDVVDVWTGVVWRIPTFLPQNRSSRGCVGLCAYLPPTVDQQVTVYEPSLFHTSAESASFRRPRFGVRRSGRTEGRLTALSPDLFELEDSRCSLHKEPTAACVVDEKWRVSHARGRHIGTSTQCCS